MSSIEQSILNVFILMLQPLLIAAISLEAAKSKACENEVIVTAITEDVNNNNYVYLFSKDLVFKVRVATLEILEVQEVKDMFPGVDISIEASCYSTNLNTYYLQTDEDMLLYTGSHNFTKLSNIDFKTVIMKQYGLKEFTESFDCAAHYNENGHVMLAFSNLDGQALACKLFPQKPRDSSCIQQGQRVPNPDGAFDANQFKDTTCEGLSIVKGEKSSDFKHRMILADMKSLRVWHDKELNISKKLSTIFDCPSNSFIVIIIILLVLGIVIVIVAGCVTIVLFVMTKRRQKVHAQATTSAESITVVPKPAAKFKPL